MDNLNSNIEEDIIDNRIIDDAKGENMKMKSDVF